MRAEAKTPMARPSMTMLSARLPGQNNKVLRRRILRVERQLIPATLRERPPGEVTLSRPRAKAGRDDAQGDGIAHTHARGAGATAEPLAPFCRHSAHSVTEMSFRGRAVPHGRTLSRGDGGAALAPFGYKTLKMDYLPEPPSWRAMEDSAAATWCHRPAMCYSSGNGPHGHVPHGGYGGYDQPAAAPYLPSPDSALALPSDEAFDFLFDGRCDVPAEDRCGSQPDTSATVPNSFPYAQAHAAPRHVIGGAFQFSTDEQYLPLPRDMCPLRAPGRRPSPQHHALTHSMYRGQEEDSGL